MKGKTYTYSENYKTLIKKIEDDSKKWKDMLCSWAGRINIIKMAITPKFSSVPQTFPILCNRIDCSMPGFLVHHQLPELAQTHVHWVSEAIQPSCPLSSPSPHAFNLSQNQGLFKWINSLHQVAKVLGASASASVLPMNIQDWFPLGWTGWISLQSKGL